MKLIGSGDEKIKENLLQRKLLCRGITGHCVKSAASPVKAAGESKTINTFDRFMAETCDREVLSNCDKSF
jgi:hypothetical protein